MKIITSTTKSLLLALFAGVVFFCLYLATLNDGFFPGEAEKSEKNPRIFVEIFHWIAYNRRC